MAIGTKLSAIAGALLLSAAHTVAAQVPPQPGEAPKPQLSMMGTGLRVADLARSLRFFKDGLGMREIGRFAMAEFDEIVLAFGEGSNAPPIFLLQARGENASVEPHPLVKGDKIILSVSDIAAVVRRLAELGYAADPIARDQRSGIQQTFVADPDGHRFELVQRPSAKQ